MQSNIRQSFDNSFLRSVEAHFHQSKAFETPHLLQLAKKVIPIDTLTKEADKKLATLQTENPNELKQELILMELLKWFKTSFFTWVDNPECQKCNGKTKMSHMSNDNLFPHTDRVEMHKCTVCGAYTPFPRYSKLDILLQTRKGRCGEWARTFTLMCYAMGWEARYVVDEGDHVWTEVFSKARNRWLHCDCCENAIDTPLMYEHGWNKKITYVMAYSVDDLQDVTWRYTSNHKEVLKRRKNCTETQLIDAIFKLRKERQKQLSSERITELTKRTLFELVEFTVEKKPGDKENQGRTSGGIDWRLMRGEVDAVKPFEWQISDTVKKSVTIRYSTALDEYQYLVDGVIKKEVCGWFNGVFSAKNIFRKEETDWKQVYLCRKEGTESASIQWSFKVTVPDKVIDEVVVTFNQKTFHTGKIKVLIKGKHCENCFTENGSKQSFLAFAGTKDLQISALLWDGEGTLAWQHAQLFRQGTNATNYPFVVQLTFKDDCRKI